MSLANVLHCPADYILICVGIDFGKARNVDLEPFNYFAYVGPLPSFFIPIKSIDVLYVYSCGSFAWMFTHNFAVGLVLCTVPITCVFQFVEVGEGCDYHSNFLPDLAAGGGCGDSSTSIGCVKVVGVLLVPPCLCGWLRVVFVLGCLNKVYRCLWGELLVFAFFGGGDSVVGCIRGGVY